MVDPLFEHCEFANWYPLFKKHVPKTRILEAPEEFREYLLSDGIVLHGGDESSSESEWESDVPRVEEQVSEDEEEEASAKSPPADFHSRIEQTIQELNGEVMPKLNWSAPVDSKWINPTNTMRCTNANDIYMLLKSSDYINHDLQLQPQKLTLVLRQWFDLHPSTEFRCFVHKSKLVAITQRDMNYYDFLESARKTITSLCTNLADELTQSFPDKSFVFDVHIPNSWSRAWLVDINPWHDKTDTLLFSWEELPQLETLELRLIEKVDRSRTFSSKPHSTSQVPYEFVNMERGTLEDMLTQMKAQRKNEQKE